MINFTFWDMALPCFTFYSMYPQTLPKNSTVSSLTLRICGTHISTMRPRWGREIPDSLRIIIEGQGRDQFDPSLLVVGWFFRFEKGRKISGYVMYIYIYISISQNFWVDTKIHIIEKKGLSWKIQVFQARHTSLSTYPMMFEDFTTSRMKMCRKWWISIQPMFNFLSNFGKGALTENAEEFPPLFGVGLASWTRWVYTWHLSYENKTRFFHSGWVSIGLYHHWK